MKIKLEFDSLEDLKGGCKNLLELFYKGNKISSNPNGRLRVREPFTQFDLDQMVKWTREGKRPQWIALQLQRNPSGISAMLWRLRRDGKLPRAARSSRVTTRIEG